MWSTASCKWATVDDAVLSAPHCHLPRVTIHTLHRKTQQTYCTQARTTTKTKQKKPADDGYINTDTLGLAGRLLRQYRCQSSLADSLSRMPPLRRLASENCVIEVVPSLRSYFQNAGGKATKRAARPGSRQQRGSARGLVKLWLPLRAPGGESG